MGIDLDELQRDIENAIKKSGEILMLGEVPPSPRIEKVLRYSAEESKNLGHTYIGTEHLLLGILREDNSKAAMILESRGVKLDKVRNSILKLLGFGTMPKSIGTESVKTPTLDDFSRDLTEIARQGKLDPVIGRQNEIERVFRSFRAGRKTIRSDWRAGVGKRPSWRALRGILSVAGSRDSVEPPACHPICPPCCRYEIPWKVKSVCGT